ncbi:MAG: DUF4838 domain-containing protein [Clostridia bacterium]|nr:DUF4838 domain-containing protein [Clostridia bacterium]
MFFINKITAHHVVDFAAEELKKYLRMMMPRCGEIGIAYCPDATDGFRLGLMQDFGLDVSEAKDTDLDDILHIDTDTAGGIIAGSNPRSVLLAVYKYLTLNGCRWLFPGIDGEWIPTKAIEAVQYHKMADSRYRGQCNEGAEYQPNMIEAIDFTPKIGLNIFMIEFDNPKYYYDCYYNHQSNPHREAEPITPETVLQWKRQCEAELSKRGLQLHDMGHGWTAEPFGLDSTDGWVAGNEDAGEEILQYMAMMDGKRALYNGVALCTNFCMSNPKARAIVADGIADYAASSTNVDYIHVWLADAANNHCECDECRKMIPSDWYVMLMNEVDERLTAKGLKTRIVFICYLDTTWAPETVRLNNPDRFSLLVAAITRNYYEPVAKHIDTSDVVLPPYERNNCRFPKSANEHLAHARLWRARCPVPSLVYEYHFHTVQYKDLGVFGFAKLVYDDVHGYRSNGYDGIIEDCTQRAYFPNGFSFYVYASALFDASVSFEELKEDYFRHAYGEDYREVIAFFEALESVASFKYCGGGMSTDPKKSIYYNPAYAESIRKVAAIADGFAPFVQAHKNMPLRAQTVAYRLLWRYLEYAKGIANAFALKAEGKGVEAQHAYSSFFEDYGKYELEMERWFDHHMIWFGMNGIFGNKDNPPEY